MPMVEKKFGRNINLKDLKEIFQRHTAALERVFVVIDAVNESEVSEQVKEMLFDLASSCKNIRMIITSTSGVDSSRLRSKDIRIVECRMSTKTIDDDIRIYVDYQIRTQSALSTLSDPLKDEVREAVLNRANGVLVATFW